MAKDPKATETKPPEEIDVTESAEPSKGIPRLYIILGMVALVLFETLLLAYWASSGPKLQKQPDIDIIEGQTELDRHKGFTGTPQPPKGAKPVDMLEKPFGKPEGEKYRVQDVDRDNPSSMSGFSCSVSVVIKKSDDYAFNKIYESNIKRIDMLVNSILRESTLEERLESSNSTIRNRIKRRALEELDILYIQDILINDPQTEIM